MARIDEFRANLVGGGARPSQFIVKLAGPTGVGAVTDITDMVNLAPFMVKAASLPASIITPIDVPYRGRIAKIAGERQFANWNVTIINDNNMKLRNALEDWSSLILAHTKTNGNTSPLSYTADLHVEQLDRNDRPVKQYTFYNCFPQMISEIGLDFGNTNSIEEFQVEFSVDYWTSIQSTTIDG